MSYRTRLEQQYPVLKRTLWVRHEGRLRLLHTARLPREQSAVAIVAIWRRHAPQLVEQELLVIETRKGSVREIPFYPESMFKGAA